MLFRSGYRPAGGGFVPQARPGNMPASNAGSAPTPAGPRFIPQAPPIGAPNPVKKAGPRKLGPGSTVEHAKYGRGTLLRVEGTGDDAKLTVSFPGHGLKKLIAKYAGIKVE